MAGDAEDRPDGGPGGGSHDPSAEAGPGGGSAAGFEAADPAAIGWGTAFGSGYLLQREIGVGGMGTVWRGWALAGQHPVAIKILHPHLSGDQAVVTRFLREGDVLKRLEHPNLVKVHDFVVEGGRLGLVMDLVEGGDLHQRRKQHGTGPAAAAARIGAQAAGGLAAAHALGVAHLDLKPANILIATGHGADGRDDVRLTDFGIARIVDSPDQATTTTTYGTPDYMAPETGLTGRTGPACDLYALGITLYEILVGRTPYGGGQALAVLARHIERAPKRLRTIPDPLWEVIAACTAREPRDRPDAASIAAYLAAAEPGLAGIPAAEPLPPGTDFETTSELRASHPNAVTVAVPWLAAVAAVAAANGRGAASPPIPEPSPVPVPVSLSLPAPPLAPSTSLTPPASSAPNSGEEAFAAALRKPPPEGPFSTAPTRPDAQDPSETRTPTFSRNTRRRTTLFGAPLLLAAVVIVALFASGAFDGGRPGTRNDTGGGVLAVRGSGQAGGQSVAAGIPTGSASASESGSTPAFAHATAKGSKPPTGPAASDSPAAGNSSAPAGIPVGVSSTAAVIESTTDPAAGATSASPSPAATDTGWVCRVGGFKVDGALSENPCVRDDDGKLMLEGELKGTYDTAVVVVVRVDYGGHYSSANVSQAVTPASLDGKTFDYQVDLGSWTPGELITCQENVNPASDKSDYEYTSNSGDIRAE